MEEEVPVAYYTSLEGAGKTFPLYTRETHAYIINYTPLDAYGNNAALNEHVEKCEAVRNFFEQCTNYQAQPVVLGPADNQEHFTDLWTAELVDKGPGDLLILYYHGEAVGNGRNYTWRFAGQPHVRINAYNLIKQINRTGADCLLLLDCGIPDRFQNKWKRNNTEIIARKNRKRDVNGNIIRGRVDFTDSMVEHLQRLYQRSVDDEYKGNAPRSIPDVMRTDRRIDHNPEHIFVNQARNKTDKEIKRIKVYPPDIRASRKIEFFAVRVAPLDQDELDALHRDEGLGEELFVHEH